jgi:probable F420-dependent oxidoreductase
VARPFRFAVQAMDLSDHDAVVSAARQAEDLGYEELYSFDHLGTVDPFVPLVVAAEATSTLRVGPLVLNNEFYHPALLARTAATVDRLSGGRLVLGVGTGYAQSEHDSMQVELRPPPRRVERLDESLAVLRSLLDTGSAQFEGRHHDVHVDQLGVRPLQEHVPILVGGFGRRVVEVAGRLADVFQFTGLEHGWDGLPRASGFALDEVVKRADWLREAAGERDGRIERSLLVQRVVVGAGVDIEEAVQQASQRTGMDSSVVESTPFLLFGSVGGIVDRLEELRETLGISHVVVREAAAFAPVVTALAGR